MDIECGVSGDGMTAQIRVDRVMGAADLEALIDELLACRAAMQPKRMPVMFADMRIRIGDGVHVQEGDGRKLIAVHHPGIGWVGAVRKDQRGRNHSA